MLFARNAAAIGVVTVSEPWALPAPARGSTSVFMVLGSSTDITLVGVRSPAGEARLVRGNAAIGGADIAAGRPLSMGARGVHLIVRKLDRRVALGDHIALTLTLRDAQGAEQEIPVNAEVRHRSPLDDERRAHAAKHAHGGRD